MSILFVVVILLFIRGSVIAHFGQAPHQMPLPAFIILVFAWYMGKKYDKALYLSSRDPLTGLFNRRYVLRQFSRAMKIANRKKRKVAVFFLDVNDFKQINDHHGHDVGD